MDNGTILYIGGFELPDKNAAAHRVVNNGKILKEFGYHVVFIDIDRSLEYTSKTSCDRKEINGVEYWSRPYPKTYKQWSQYLFNIDFFIEVICKYSDIKAVICYNYQAIALMKIKKYCNKNNIKILADCTEWYSTKGNNIIFKLVKGFDSFLRMRVIHKQLDGLIVISHYLENYYAKQGYIVRIPPLVDLSEDIWERETPQSGVTKVRLVYAGNPGKNKDNLNCVIEILYQLKDLSDYIFYIVGITKEEYLKDNPKQLYIINKLNANIEFKGKVSHTESLNYIKKADFSVLVRANTRVTKAGFPTKLVESITCGTPVITTKTGDIEEYIAEDRTGAFIDMHDRRYSGIVLRKILLMNNDDRNRMKNFCLESNGFYYKNYIDLTKVFLDKVFAENI